MTDRFVSGITVKGYPYIVAEDENGQMLGYAYASAFRTRPAYRWLVEDSIYLAPSAQGRGIGKLLLKELVERCTALGFRQMVAVIGGASPASAGLHSALGFRMVGTMTGTGFKHGQWWTPSSCSGELGEGKHTDPDTATYPGSLFQG